VADLFQRSVADLSHEKRTTRLGAIYSLGYIAKQYRDLSWPVIEVLALHLREDYHADGDADPPVEVHEIMNILKSDLESRGSNDAG
jgi:hypothetical protein